MLTVISEILLILAIIIFLLSFIYPEFVVKKPGRTFRKVRRMDRKQLRRMKALSSLVTTNALLDPLYIKPPQKG